MAFYFRILTTMHGQNHIKFAHSVFTLRHSEQNYFNTNVL